MAEILDSTLKTIKNIINTLGSLTEVVSNALNFLPEEILIPLISVLGIAIVFSIYKLLK